MIFAVIDRESRKVKWWGRCHAGDLEKQAAHGVALDITGLGGWKNNPDDFVYDPVSNSLKPVD